ncbi:hypothetical protein EJ06DRAFT_527705 [Trichodelitschia bisporula]|uniref:Uncharacterized protein n=1 Tax=Trichodelitschia bisporula TaxID=703511 RepID=A0A6G1I351_9PEZI|nr:hypothetical protein EJ06DRAFT_527705 [Trichodelitschia bisporula]
MPPFGMSAETIEQLRELVRDTDSLTRRGGGSTSLARTMNEVHANISNFYDDFKRNPHRYQ